MKSWNSHLDQITEMQKKEGSEGKDKKSGSDGPEVAETGESGEGMEEVEKGGETTIGVATGTEPARTEVPAPEDKGAEDFEMIEGGGEDDLFAQEKAVEKAEGNGDDAVSAAEQPKEDLAEPMGTVP